MRLGLFFVVLSTAAAHATVVEGLDLTEQCGRAEWIVRGKVTGQKSDWTPERQIVTVSQLRVLEVLKGRGVPRSLAVRQLGGTADGQTLVVSGNARLEPGEEVVLFLQHDAAFVYVLGLAQGKFTVHRDAAGVSWLERDLSELGVLERFRQSPVRQKDAPIRLDHLRRLVRP